MTMGPAMGLLFAADTDAIAAYVSSVALLEDAERALAADGIMHIDRDGEQRRNPWLIVRKDALESIHRLPGFRRSEAHDGPEKGR